MKWSRLCISSYWNGMTILSMGLVPSFLSSNLTLAQWFPIPSLSHLSTRHIETQCPTLHHPRSHPIYVIFSADSSTPLSCPDIFHVNLGFSLMTYLRARRMLIVSTHTHNNIHQLRYQYTQHSKQPISLSCWWIRSNTPPFTFTLPQHNPLSTSIWLHYVAHLLHLIWMLCLWTTRG